MNSSYFILHPKKLWNIGQEKEMPIIYNTGQLNNERDIHNTAELYL